MNSRKSYWGFVNRVNSAEEIKLSMLTQPGRDHSVAKPGGGKAIGVEGQSPEEETGSQKIRTVQVPRLCSIV